MPRKPKFKPEVTRVKLNPEQAILGCCYDQGNIITLVAYNAGASTPIVCYITQGGQSKASAAIPVCMVSGIKATPYSSTNSDPRS